MGINKNSSYLQDLDFVSDCLHDADAYSLTSEVVTTALHIMKNNSTKGIELCMEEAMIEWDI